MVSTHQNMAFRNDIQGMRAIAVAAVIGYHMHLPLFAGGFVGVDIFFVISGFLIGGIIYRQLISERFSIYDFYKRRIIRLLPAFFATIVFCCVLAMVALAPSDLVQFGWSVLSASLGTSNIFFYTDAPNGGYFDTQQKYDLLLHTWSLSIEEQFYAIFPLLIYLILRFCSRMLVPIISASAILSFLCGIFYLHYQHNQPAAFYFIQARCWEFALGTLLSVHKLLPFRSRWTQECATSVGLSLVLYAIIFFTDKSPFPGVNVIFPSIGTLLLIVGGREPGSVISRILGWRILTFFGAISYSLYIWHWPIIKISDMLIFDKSIYFQSFILLATFVVSTLSFYLVEKPARSRVTGKKLWRSYVLGAGALITTATIGCLFIYYNGIPQRFSPETLAKIDANIARKTDWPEGDCLNFRKLVHNWNEINTCPVSKGEKTNVLFWGDSHTDQFRVLFRGLYDEGMFHGSGLIFAMSAGCPPARRVSRSNPLYHCNVFSELVFQRALQPDIVTVYIGLSNFFAPEEDGVICLIVDGQCSKQLKHKDAERIFLVEILEDIKLLRAAGKQVVIGLPTPEYFVNIPDLQITSLTLGQLVTPQRPIPQFDQDYIDDLVDSLKDTGVPLFQPWKKLCNLLNCIFQVDGVSIYRDNDHIAGSQGWLFYNDMKVAFEQSNSSR